MRTLEEVVRDEMEKHTATTARCPVGLKTFDFRKRCPQCDADASEPCRLRVVADANFVSNVSARALQPVDVASEQETVL